MILEKKKFYKIYGQYGLFLYNEMHIFDKALQIFEEGYKNHDYECSFCCFRAQKIRLFMKKKISIQKNF